MPELLSNKISNWTIGSNSPVTVLTANNLQVDNLNLDNNTLSASSGAVNITPAEGSAIVLDGTINIDGGEVTGATSISTAFSINR